MTHVKASRLRKYNYIMQLWIPKKVNTILSRKEFLIRNVCIFTWLTRKQAMNENSENSKTMGDMFNYDTLK